MPCKLVLLIVEYHKIFGNIICVKSLKMKLRLRIKENIKKIKIKIKRNLILIIWYNLKLQRKIIIQIIKIFISFQKIYFLWNIKKKKNKF